VFTLWSWKGAGGLAEARTAVGPLPADHEWTEWIRFWQEAFEGKYDEALQRMEADPEGWVRLKIQAAPKLLLAAALRAARGDAERAREEFETARKMLEAELPSAPEDARYHSSLGVALAGLGRREEAVREGRRGLELLPVAADAVYGISHVIDLAHIHILLGDKAEALGQLEFLLSRPGWISEPFLRLDPRWRPLRDDPRFEALLAKFAVKR
jgi:serine/threonine-protein kinase